MVVSILIPCFNAERWVAQAIESALTQTWPEKEVIVVDDGSTDGSLEVIKRFGDRIRWETGPNRGGNPTRNRLLELARGEWVQYLDADDYLLPAKVEAQLGFVAEPSDADVIYSPVLTHIWSEEGSEPVRNPWPVHTDDLWVSLVRWYVPQTGGFLYRTAALRDVGGWNPSQPCCQEAELYLRLLMGGKRFTHCPVTGAVYRLWSQQTVSKKSPRVVRDRRLEIIQRAEDHLRSIRQLTPKRLLAINQARFEQARSAWLTDRAAAREIVATVRRSQPGFLPDAPVPASYRTLYRVFGFRFAETVAGWRRAAGPRTGETLG